MPKDKKPKPKKDSAEKRATEKRGDMAYDRATQHGDPQCAPQTLGTVAEEIEIEEAAGWITLSIQDPELPDEDGHRYTMNVGHVLGYCASKNSKGEPFFALLLKGMPTVSLDAWNMDEAAAIHDKFHEVMRDVSTREPD